MIIFIWAMKAMYKLWWDSHEKYLLTYYLIHETPTSVKCKTKRAPRKINANKKHCIKCDFSLCFISALLSLYPRGNDFLSYCQRKLGKESQSYRQLGYLKVWNTILWQYIDWLIHWLTDHFLQMEYKIHWQIEIAKCLPCKHENLSQCPAPTWKGVAV